MSRRLPAKLTPHENAVIVEPLTGSGANGRLFGAARTIPVSNVTTGSAIRRSATTSEANAVAIVIYNTSDLDGIPPSGSRVTIWRGEPEEVSGTVASATRHQHPRIADYVELVVE